MNFAIIGCGHIAKRHAQLIPTYGNLVAVCDTDTHKAQAFAANHAARAYTDLAVLLQEETTLDLVVICTPNGLHAAHSIACLQAGKHVLCEKPMAIASSDCDAMIAMAKAKHKQLFVVKQNRFNPPVQAVKKAIDEHRLGNLFAVQVNGFWNRNENYYQDAWRGTLDLDGGTLYTQFSHFIDVLLYLMGDLASVQWMGENYMHSDSIAFEDTGIACLQFKNKAIGTLQYTVNAYEKNMEGSITIFGTKGTVKIGGAYLNELTYQAIEDYHIALEQSTQKENDYGSYKGSMSNHDQVYANMMQVLNDQASPITSLEEARNTVYWIEQMYGRK
jgi:predicted dehydrogenase